MNIKTVLAVAITLAFWSSAFAGIRAGLSGGYSPGHLVLLRFLAASAVFLLYALVRRVQIPSRADFVRIMLLGFTGISIYHITLTFGELSVPAGTASILIAAAPAITAVISMFVLRERLSFLGWTGIVLGFAGIALITFSSGTAHGFMRGALLIVVSAIATSVFFVYQKPLFARYSAIDLTAWFTWSGTIPMLVFLPGFVGSIRHATVAATLSGVYIGIFPAAISYVAWAVALASSSPGKVTSSLYINPVLAIFIAWIWLGELPHWTSLIGGCIAISGVIIVNVFGSPRRKVTPEPTDAVGQAL